MSANTKATRLLAEYLENERLARLMIAALVESLDRAVARDVSASEYMQRHTDSITLTTRLRDVANRREELREAYNAASAEAREPPVDSPLGAFDERYLPDNATVTRLDAVLNPVEAALVNDAAVHTLTPLTNEKVRTYVRTVVDSELLETRTRRLTLITVAAGRGWLLLNNDDVRMPLQAGLSALVPTSASHRVVVERGLYGGGQLRLVVRELGQAEE